MTHKMTKHGITKNQIDMYTENVKMNQINIYYWAIDGKKWCKSIERTEANLTWLNSK